MEQPITVGCLEGCDWLLHSFIEVNFSKLTDSNQISGMIQFTFIVTSVKFQFKLISAKIFLPMFSCNELSITLSTLWPNYPNSFSIPAHSNSQFVPNYIHSCHSHYTSHFLQQIQSSFLCTSDSPFLCAIQCRWYSCSIIQTCFRIYTKFSIVQFSQQCRIRPSDSDDHWGLVWWYRFNSASVFLPLAQNSLSAIVVHCCKKEDHSVCLQEMWNSCKSIFPKDSCMVSPRIK